MFLTGALLALGTAGCGGTRNVTSSAGSQASTGNSVANGYTPTTTEVIPPGQPVRGDGDADNPSDIDGNGDADGASVGGPDSDKDNPTRESYNFPDRDDKVTFAYGHRPNAAEAQAVASVVKRYYAAASAADGAQACALLVPSVARAAPADYGGFAGPTYLRGARTCPALLSRMFKHFHRELAEAITLVQVRVEGDRAQAIFSSRSMPASSLPLTRQGGSWKVPTLIGQPLP